MKLLSYNVQDLFLFLDHYQGENIEEIDEKKWSSFSGSIKKNKSLEKLFGIKKVIIDTDPDVILLVEIGGKESLENFNRLFLNNGYQVFIRPSNSKRGIDIGYLVKKKFEAKISSHRKWKLPNNEKLSRDIPELRLYQSGKLLAVLLGVHFKSKLDLERKDFEGREQRSNEVMALTQLFKQLRKSIHRVPIVLAGDFNGIIQKQGREPEFSPLFENTQLEDIFELIQYPENERYTHLFFSSGLGPIANQIDAVLIEKRYADQLIVDQCKVYRYKNDYGDQVQIETFKEKTELPSDHFPILMTLHLGKTK